MDVDQHFRGTRHGLERPVLIIDDDEEMLELLERVLVREGLRVETAHDGNEALTKIKTLQPKAIVTDLMFPWVKGQEVQCIGQALVEEIQTGSLAGIPVIVMSALIKDEATRALVCGQPNVVGFLEKPIDQATLLSVLARALRTALS